jgi:hypothetical protein
MYNEVQTVTGRTGAPTRALFSQILQSGCCGTNGQGDGSTQEPYIIFPAGEVGELYMSFWVKLQPDLVQKLDSADPWRALFEVKTTDTDWRLVVGITDWGKVGQAMWDLSTDTYVPTYQRFWRLLNVPSVPVDRWFKLEVYWKRSSGSDGRVWMAADGKVLADQFGPNMGPNRSRIDRIFWNLYTGGAYPIYQWIDDVQIWSSFPTAKAGDPWYDGVYAPH